MNVLQALRQDIADEIVAKFTLFTRNTVWISNKLNNPAKSYDIQKP